MSIEVSSPGLIKLRIAKSNNSNVSSMKNYKNVIEFNVSDGYIVDTYTCTSGDYTYDNMNDTLTISNMREDTYCTVNYKEGYKKLYDIIMGQPLVLNNGLRETTNTNTGKSSFYYRGQVENNYVELDEKEGKSLYRIVRINEDGSIRLIRQDGINNNDNYYFNDISYNEYKYMYYSESNIEDTANNKKGIMKRINDWYAKEIETSSINEKIVENSFCEEAKVKYLSGFTSGNANMQVATNNYIPDLKCATDANDKELLNMKVGLLTADEVVYAGYPFYTGGTQTNNTNIYLQNGTYWWIMSPAGFDYSNNARAWLVTSLGYILDSDVKVRQNNIRPVFSLASTVEVTGKGTEFNPFRIK